MKIVIRQGRIGKSIAAEEPLLVVIRRKLIFKFQDGVLADVMATGSDAGADP